MWRFLSYIYSFFFGTLTAQKDNAEPQTSSPEPKAKETVASEPLSDEDEASLPESLPLQVPLENGQKINMVHPTVRENTAGAPLSKTEQIPPVALKSQSDEVNDKSILLKSSSESLSVCQGPLKEEQKINMVQPAIRENTGEAFSTEPKTDEIPSVAPKRFSDEVKDQSVLLKSSSESLPVYQVPLEEERINVSGCRRYRFGKESLKTNRTIMVMGATGAGKSTLIDGMINYILGVDWNDKYRFKLVKEVQKGTQAKSQTSEVTVYKLNHQEGFQITYSLTIIDTPGFGDTGGIENDRKITEKIRNLFTSKASQVLELDAVCFVVQSALARLTPSQKYVFDSVLSIFGKDIKENIRVLVTFADGQRPPVLAAITESGVPCPEEKGAPLHFKFNNSALFACNKKTAKREDEEDEEDDFDEMFWNMGNKSMKRFFVALNQIKTRSLILTTMVLSERKQLENLVENLQKQVRVGLLTLEEIKQTSDILLTHQAEINRNAKFEYEVTVIEPHQVLKKENTFITNCQQCSYTCHETCAYANDADKIKCSAMKNGNCTVCPGKCIWSVHFNQKYKWEYKEVTKKETLQKLKERYEIATGEKNAAELILKKVEDEYNKVQIEVTVMMDRSSACLNRLKEIALKPDPLSTPDYIDMLIEGEKTEAKPGWNKRVESLMEMKQRAEYLAKVEKGEILLEHLAKVKNGDILREYLVEKKEILLDKKQRMTSAIPSFITRLFKGVSSQ